MKLIAPLPIYLSTIWGGTKLSKIRRISPPPGEAFGICREVSTYHNAENTVANGEFAGMNLQALVKQYHKDLMGDDPSDQLVRVAYLDADENLSIQVHPDAEYAIQVEKDYEKSEAWYILQAEKGARIVAGTTIKEKGKIKEAIINGTFSTYFEWIPVRAGDLVMIPAGMMHACGKGILALEVGSFGGITYRLWDYGRGRALDIDKGLQVLDTALKADIKHFTPLERPLHGVSIRKGIRHTTFCTDLVDVKDSWIMEKRSNSYVIMTVLEGDALIEAQGFYEELSFTHTVIVPACIRELTVQGNCRLMLSYRGPESLIAITDK
jgi:mannose-6-phosphate isomerase